VQFDSAAPWGDHFYWREYGWSPPVCDAIPTIDVRGPDHNPACINRHGGGINAVFLDWSVRKVGLKELWTLEWHRKYDTTGPWTKAGGALPRDWPKWMRSFRDY
jgi:prepilin-type processing-associated H-X9-DG protein